VLSQCLPAIDDPEGAAVPDALPFIVDSHVHVFPNELFSAIRKWFDQYAWKLRYTMDCEDISDFLVQRGVGHVIALQYAHKPGIASQLNEFMADYCARHKGVAGAATVLPGEKRAGQILEKAFANGLCAVKLHAHVQYFDMNSSEMEEIYETCIHYDKPLVMHVGREPRSPAVDYLVDPHLICKAEKLEQVLAEHPALKVCVPHLGADEFEEYARLTRSYDNLWLDIAMAIANYLPGPKPMPLESMRADRILYGTDFPNIPYEWDRELKILCKAGLPPADLQRILGQNAVELFGLAASRPPETAPCTVPG
jgi:predicted TIM-barrel fold metal-dependent hydrolase